MWVAGFNWSSGKLNACCPAATMLCGPSIRIFLSLQTQISKCIDEFKKISQLCENPQLPRFRDKTTARRSFPKRTAWHTLAPDAVMMAHLGASPRHVGEFLGVARVTLGTMIDHLSPWPSQWHQGCLFQKFCSSTSLKSTFVLHNILVFKFWGRQIHQSHLIPTMVSLRQFADLMHRFQSNQHVFSAIRQENLHPPSTGRIFWKVTTQWLSSTCGVGGSCATTVGALRRVMPIANWVPCRKSRPEATISISRSWCIKGISSQPDICVRNKVERIRGPVRLWFSLCRCWSTELQVQRSDSSEHSPAAAKARTASSIVIESVRTPEPRVQGQGISPDCDFASRPATKEQSPFRCQPATGLPLVQRLFNERPTRWSPEQTGQTDERYSFHQSSTKQQRHADSATLRYHVCSVSAPCPNARLFTLEQTMVCAHKWM